MKLTISEEQGKTVEQELTQGTYKVGRGEGCEVLLDDETASREHCIIEVLKGKSILRDLGSMNGTLLNDKRTDEAELKDGDVIALGRTKMTVSLAAPAEEEAKDESPPEAEKPKEESPPEAEKPKEESPPEAEKPKEEGSEESPGSEEGGEEPKPSESES